MVFLIGHLLLGFETGRIIDFEDNGWGLLFENVQLFLSYCTNKGSQVNKGVFCSAILEIQRDIERFVLSFQDNRGG